MSGRLRRRQLFRLGLGATSLPLLAACHAAGAAGASLGTSSPLAFSALATETPVPTPTPFAAPCPTPLATPTMPAPTATPIALAPGAPTPMPVISRQVPAFASAKSLDASKANDLDYGTEWRSYMLPAWLAYDLSGVPPPNRGKVVVAYYNNSYGYDKSAGPHYSNAAAYTIQGNPAAGGPFPPDDGWATLVSVTGNSLHSRQHVVDLTGHNWIRMYVTASDGAPQNDDVRLNLDVHDASQGIEDDWIFYGDALVTEGMSVAPVHGVDTFAKLINAAIPDHFPAAEGGGIPNQTTADGAARIRGWLAEFPGKYVGLAFGTKDAANCTDPDAFQRSFETMVQAVLAAGKVPVVPTIPWAPDAGVQRCGPTLNARLRSLYSAHAQLVPGPDLWSFFASNQSLIPPGDIHPNDQGYAAYRLQWVNQMLARVYRPAGKGTP